MDTPAESPQAHPSPRWPLRLIALGAALILLAAGGFALLMFQPAPQPGLSGAAATPTPDKATKTPEPTPTRAAVAMTPADDARIDRQLVSPPTHTPTPTLTPTATPTSTATATAAISPSPSPVPVTPEPIVWTQEEKNALSWMCYGEVGGMGAAKIDACLSVISTVRVRYAYANNFAGDDLLSTLFAPGQFNVPMYTDRPGPDPDLMWAVEQYAAGMRGSCTGFRYFNSIPGGPAQCTIYASNGQFLQFHNSW